MQVAANRESGFDRLVRLCREAELSDVTIGTTFEAPALRARDKSFASLKVRLDMISDHELKGPWSRRGSSG